MGFQAIKYLTHEGSISVPSALGHANGRKGAGPFRPLVAGFENGGDTFDFIAFWNEIAHRALDV